MRVRIRGRYWRLVRRLLRAPADGFCDPPDTCGKEIVIRRGLSEPEDLRVLIHELLHAGLWDLDEAVVDELSTDMARILIRDGWHR